VGKKPCLSLGELEKQIGYDLDTQMDLVGKKISTIKTSDAKLFLIKLQ